MAETGPCQLHHGRCAERLRMAMAMGSEGQALGEGSQIQEIVRAVGMVLEGKHNETYQWEFQDPKMEVPTIYKAYVRAI